MTKPVIDLSGPKGNAFYILSVAKQLAKDLDLDGPAIHSEMISSDYNHLLEVFEKHFGEHVILRLDEDEDG